LSKRTRATIAARALRIRKTKETAAKPWIADGKLETRDILF
jgi:hypothetical protein